MELDEPLNQSKDGVILALQKQQPIILTCSMLRSSHVITPVNGSDVPCYMAQHPYHANVLPRMKLSPSLAHNYIAWLAALPTIQLDAQHLWQRATAILRGPPLLL